MFLEFCGVLLYLRKSDNKKNDTWLAIRFQAVCHQSHGCNTELGLLSIFAHTLNFHDCQYTKGHWEHEEKWSKEKRSAHSLSALWTNVLVLFLPRDGFSIFSKTTLTPHPRQSQLSLTPPFLPSVLDNCFPGYWVAFLLTHFVSFQTYTEAHDLVSGRCHLHPSSGDEKQVTWWSMHRFSPPLAQPFTNLLS